MLHDVVYIGMYLGNLIQCKGLNTLYFKIALQISSDMLKTATHTQN